MNLEEKKYDAFISYRHSDLDQYVAVTLHKELEAFRIPRNMEKQLKAQGINKKKIDRVFRDRDELPITNNLADPITNALRNSEYLLVICSPRLPQSIWCKTEVETFIKMHGREHVFAVLAEGEPQESFPEALLYEEQSITDEKGNVSVTRVPVEPLAADVRGKTKKEIKKKIKDEVLRLAAPMFACGYDDLKQRHREQKIKRTITAAVAVCAVFGTFALVSTALALQIHSQSKKIQQQNDKIEEQYQEALKQNAVSTAENALELMEQGDKKKAVELACQALNGSGEQQMPYTAQAEYALSEALQVYENNNRAVPSRLLEQESAVQFFKISPDRQTMMVVDRYGNLTLWNPKTGEQLYETAIEGSSFYLQDSQACFINNETICLPAEKGFIVYDFVSGEEHRAGDGSIYLCKADQSGEKILIATYDTVTIYYTKDLSVCSVYEKGTGESIGMEADFSEDGSIAAVEMKQLDEKAGILILDTDTGAGKSIWADYDGLTELSIQNDRIYAAAYKGMLEISSELFCYDFLGNCMWSYQTESMINNIKAFGIDGGNYLAVRVYSKMYVLNKEDGSLIGVCELASEIVGYGAIMDSNTLVIMTRNGIYHFLNTDTMEDVVLENQFVTNSDNIRDFQFGDGYFASFSYNDTAMTIYETAVGSEVKEIFETESSPINLKINQEETAYAYELYDNDGSNLQVTSYPENEIIGSIETQDYIADFEFASENTLEIILNKTVCLYDVKSGEETGRVELEIEEDTSISNSDMKFIDEGKKVAAITGSSILIYDAAKGNLINRLDAEDISGDGLKVYCVNQTGEGYAYISAVDNTLKTGTFKGSASQNIPIKGKCVSNLSLNQKADIVYVTYLDGKVEAYGTADGQLLNTYTEFEDEVESIEEYEEQNKTILVTASKAYILNEEKELIGCVKGYKGLAAKNQKMLLSASKIIYEVPVYNLDMLLQEGNTY